MKSLRVIVLICSVASVFSSHNFSNVWKDLADREFANFSKDEPYSYIYKTKKPPKNVILFIGDGLSMSTHTAARYMKAFQEKKKAGDILLAWDSWSTASLLRTFNEDQMTTESASSATSLFCGEKVPQKVLGISGQGKCCECSSHRKDQELKSIFVHAQKAGLATGIVTTTRITHATPAATYAHSAVRSYESYSVPAEQDKSFRCGDIASQLITKGLDFNVTFGGGLAYFYQHNSSALKQKGRRTDGRNLLEEWKQKQKARQRRARVVLTREDLIALDTDKIDHVLGLFADDHMEYDLDRGNLTSLVDMVEMALKILLRNSKGFLLMVEGGRIDMAHHNNQAKKAIFDTLALETAVIKAQKMTNSTDTLMVLTADHSHTYGIVAGGERNDSILAEGKKYTPLDGKKYLISTYFNGPGAAVNRSRGDPDAMKLHENEFRQQSLVPLSQSTHTAEDVPLFATGPYNQLFHRAADNTYLNYATLFSLCLGPYNDYPHCSQKNGVHFHRVSPWITVVTLFVGFKL